MAYGSDEPTLEESVDLARSKVFTPALFLIILGVCNLLVAGLVLFTGLAIDRVHDDELKRMHTQSQKDMSAQEKEELKRFMDNNGGPVAFYRNVGKIFKRSGIFGMIAAVMCIAAGARMIVVRTYGLAMTGSILMMVPVLSPMCCCGIGLAIGIWNLVVLFNQEVRVGFAANRSLGANGGQPPDDFRRDDYSEDRPGY